MSSHVKLRKERVSVVDYDIQIKGKRHVVVCATLKNTTSLFHTILTLISETSF